MPFCSPEKVISSRCEGYSSRDFIVHWEPPRRTQGENVHSVKKLILLEYLSLKNNLDGYGKMKEAWAGKASDFRISWKLPDRPSQSLYLSSLRILLHWLPLCIEVCVCSHVRLFANLWTVAHQAPLSMEFSVHGILAWIAISHSKGSSWIRCWTHISWVSYIGRSILYHCATWETQVLMHRRQNSLPWPMLNYRSPADFFKSHVPRKS